MLFTTFSTALVVLSVLAPAATMPTIGWGNQPRGSPNLAKLAKLVPKNTLPPPGDLQLKYVLLGLGTQNYTCSTGVATATPGTTGALATLYDLGSRLNTDPLAAWKIASISGLALSMNMAPNKKMIDMYLQSQGYQKVLGNHFFSPLSTGNTPTFSLSKVNANPFPIAFVTKDPNGTMDAPSTACPGTQNEGAVPWLKLVDGSGLSQGGINTVYRLETAGGKQPATCDGRKPYFEVPYAAQYWIYGTK